MAANSKEDLPKALGQLVIVVADTLKLVLENQAVQKFENKELSKTEEDSLSEALFELDKKIFELKELFDLDPYASEGLHLGKFDGVNINLQDTVSALINKGLVVRGDAQIGIGNVGLANINLMLHLSNKIK